MLEFLYKLLSMHAQAMYLSEELMAAATGSNSRSSCIRCQERIAEATLSPTMAVVDSRSLSGLGIAPRHLCYHYWTLWLLEEPGATPGLAMVGNEIPYQ